MDELWDRSLHAYCHKFHAVIAKKAKLKLEKRTTKAVEAGIQSLRLYLWLSTFAETGTKCSKDRSWINSASVLVCVDDNRWQQQYLCSPQRNVSSFQVTLQFTYFIFNQAHITALMSSTRSQKVTHKLLKQHENEARRSLKPSICIGCCLCTAFTLSETWSSAISTATVIIDSSSPMAALLANALFWCCDAKDMYSVSPRWQGSEGPEWIQFKSLYCPCTLDSWFFCVTYIEACECQSKPKRLLFTVFSISLSAYECYLKQGMAHVCL